MTLLDVGACALLQVQAGPMKNFRLEQRHSPVQYSSAWMRKDDAAPSQLRAGMRALQLWCLRISWTGAETVSSSCDVLISDSDQRDHVFETFAVIRPDCPTAL